MTEPASPLVSTDCHTHIGVAGVHVNDPLRSDSIRAWGHCQWDVDLADHREASRASVHTVVLAFDAEPVGVVVPNQYVADYVAGDERLIGFASVNPTRPDAVQRLVDGIEKLGLRGLKLGPAYQHFNPCSAESYELLEVADHYRLPVIWHQGTTFVGDAWLEVAQPYRLDAIARRFPDLPMWIAHLGHPWTEEAAAVVRKHEHLYADISALGSRPFQFYNALTHFSEYKVMDRLLFGTDYPFSDVASTVAALRSVNELTTGSGLPRLAEEDLEAILARDALPLLGLSLDGPASGPADQVVLDTEDGA